MHIEESPQANPTEANTPIISPFEEIKDMDDVKAINILIQASNAAQKAGALSVRDSVLLAAAAEYLTQPYADKK
jgi:hypothetical protein|tara:strand:- start:1374 stop:1595 length:222 start_codon:yes stop_codon:yes gene_type:complete